MRIRKTTHNALQILIAAARAGDELVKGAAIAKELNLTEQNTSKIVYLLSRGGFIKAVRGPHGGMTLARKPDEIRIGDVVLAMENMALEDARPLRAGQDLTQLARQPAHPETRRSTRTEAHQAAKDVPRAEQSLDRRPAPTQRTNCAQNLELFHMA